MSSVVIAGVGTDIGKTYVSCALLRRWRAQGAACAVLKPVLSGYDAASFLELDFAKLLLANGQPATPDAIAAISPWRYSAALSPPAAAEREGITLDFAEIVKFCRNAIAANPNATTLVETAGGVMSPLTHDRTVLDLIAALGPPVILVTGSYLGAVSHTLTALEALRGRSQRVALLVVNESDGGVGLADTCEMVRTFHPDLATVAVTRSGDLPAHIPSL